MQINHHFLCAISTWYLVIPPVCPLAVTSYYTLSVRIHYWLVLKSRHIMICYKIWGQNTLPKPWATANQPDCFGKRSLLRTRSINTLILELLSLVLLKVIMQHSSLTFSVRMVILKGSFYVYNTSGIRNTMPSKRLLRNRDYDQKSVWIFVTCEPKARESEGSYSETES